MNLASGLLAQRTRTSRQTDGSPRCQHCGSRLVQPQGWRELPGRGVLLHLRCPECLASWSASFEYELIAEYDEALVRGRLSLLADYETIVRHNMQELAERFASALELDLIGPDDFRRGANVHGLQSAPEPIRR